MLLPIILHRAFCHDSDKRCLPHLIHTVLLKNTSAFFLVNYRRLKDCHNRCVPLIRSSGDIENECIKKRIRHPGNNAVIVELSAKKKKLV